MKYLAHACVWFVAFGFLSSCSSSGGSAGRACVDDTVCEDGQICGTSATCETVRCSAPRDCPGSSTCLPTGLCGPIECASSSQCGDGGKVCRDQVCVNVTDLPACGDGGACDNGKVCNAASGRCEDCNTSTLRCPAGQNCRSGSCEAQNTSCNNDAPCLPTGRVCDLVSHACVACSVTRPCPNTHFCEAGQCKRRPTCTNGMCTAPLTCDTATNFCINAGGVNLCGACTADAECSGTGSKCLVLTGGSACGQVCSTSTPCPSGFTCAPYMGGSQCIPTAGRCSDNCGLPGATCPSGRSCDQATGLCLASKRLCDACGADDECGAPTDKCLQVGDGGGRVCAQDCDTSHVGGRTCPVGFTCRDITAGVKQCVPQGAECVVDPCENLNCTGTTPHCDAATRTCVECLQAIHCPASDQICTPEKTCVVPGQCTNDQSCTGDPGGPKCCQTTLGQKCSQCCVNTDCPSARPYCVANVCQTTMDPCATVNCNPGTACNPATGQCETTGGGGTSCQTDSDCPAMSPMGGAYMCDPMFHFCYDTTGFCASDGECVPGQTCALFCAGCTATGGYCAGGALCLPGFDICFPL